MKRLIWILPAVAVLLSLTGCDGDDDTASLRVVHASPDAPNVNVRVDGQTSLQGVPYNTGSGFLPVKAGTIDIQVDAILPGGNTTPVIGPAQLDLGKDTKTTVLAVGKVATSTLEPLVLENPSNEIAAGNARVQVVHAAPDAPSVDVYVTVPGADLVNQAPVGSFAFKETLGPVEVPAATYQIRVTLPGQPQNIVYDSGSVNLANGSDLLVAATANTLTGTAPIGLLVLDGSGSDVVLDANTPADVRVVHNSPDAPAVDVIVNDDTANPAVVGLPFPEFTGYLNIPPGDYNFKVTATGNPGAVVIDQDASLEGGVASTVMAVNFLNSIEPLVLEDDNRSVATEARVRIVHGSPSAGPVDIYVTAPGNDINLVEPNFANVPFKANTGYVSLAGGAYTVTVTPTGTKTAAIGPVNVTIENGVVYTAVARDNVGGGLPLGLILMDGFAASP